MYVAVSRPVYLSFLLLNSTYKEAFSRLAVILYCRSRTALPYLEAVADSYQYLQKLFLNNE